MATAKKSESKAVEINKAEEVKKEVVTENKTVPVEQPEKVDSISMTPEDYEEYKLLKAERDREIKAQAIKKEDYSYFKDFEKGSSLPGWSMPKHIDMLRDEVNSIKGRLDFKQVPDDEVYMVQEEYKMKKKRLEDIENSKPVLTGKQMDELVKKRDKLAEEISRSKFSQYDMERGLADPHEEARRMTEPCIEMDEEEARRMGLRTQNGKVPRTEAEMAWKLMCSLIGDTQLNPNPEILRSVAGSMKKKSQVTVPDMPWLRKKESVGV